MLTWAAARRNKGAHQNTADSDRTNGMGSKTKKVKAIRKRKAKSNRDNLKANQKRIDENIATLRELSSKD